MCFYKHIKNSGDWDSEGVSEMGQSGLKDEHGSIFSQSFSWRFVRDSIIGESCRVPQRSSQMTISHRIELPTPMISCGQNSQQLPALLSFFVRRPDVQEKWWPSVTPSVWWKSMKKHEKSIKLIRRSCGSEKRFLAFDPKSSAEPYPDHQLST